jgi:hypothetical protein
LGVQERLFSEMGASLKPRRDHLGAIRRGDINLHRAVFNYVGRVADFTFADDDLARAETAAVDFRTEKLNIHVLKKFSLLKKVGVSDHGRCDADALPLRLAHNHD